MINLDEILQKAKEILQKATDRQKDSQTPVFDMGYAAGVYTVIELIKEHQTK